LEEQQEEQQSKEKKIEFARPSPIRRNMFSQILAGILVNAIYEMRNYPVVLVNTVLSPISFLVLIGFVSRGTLLGEAIIGGFIMSMFSAGMSLQADLSHLKNDFKLQDMVVSSPASWQVYVFGMASSEIIYSLPALIVLSILAVILIHTTVLGGLVIVSVLLLMLLASIALGYTFATLSSDIVQSFAYSRMLSTLFSTLPPVYYPITYIPMPFQYLAYLSPTTYAAELAQSAAGYLSISFSNMILDWSVLIAVTVALAAIAASKARWREV
jgi:ABC-2 type transport system permease protein